MEFLNLTLGQFLAVFAVICRRLSRPLPARPHPPQTSRLHPRFWVAPGQPAPVSRRRRIQQPLSLLLQLLGMALLLLAIAEFQFGGGFNKRRDHVLVLDTSAWMAARCPAAPTPPSWISPAPTPSAGSAPSPPQTASSSSAPTA